MDTLELPEFDFIFEYLGYTMGVLNTIKCIIGIILHIILIGTTQQKEDKQNENADLRTNLNLRNRIYEILVYIVTLAGASLELILVIFLKIGIYLEKPWMLLPWVIVAVLNVVIDFVNLIRSGVKKQISDIPSVVFSIIAIVLSITSLGIMIRLYKSLRIKKKQQAWKNR